MKGSKQSGRSLNVCRFLSLHRCRIHPLVYLALIVALLTFVNLMGLRHGLIAGPQKPGPDEKGPKRYVQMYNKEDMWEMCVTSGFPIWRPQFVVP